MFFVFTSTINTKTESKCAFGNIFCSISFINIVLTQAFIYNTELLQKSDVDSHLLLFRLTTDLKNCINGLVNLKQTYFHDKLVHSELDVMIDNIRSKIDMNSKKLKFIK